MDNIERKICEIYKKFLNEKNQKSKITYAYIICLLYNIDDYKMDTLIFEEILLYLNSAPKKMIENIQKQKDINIDNEKKSFNNFYYNDDKSYKIIKSVNSLIYELYYSVNNFKEFRRHNFISLKKYINNTKNEYTKFLTNEQKNIIRINDYDFAFTIVNRYSDYYLYLIGNNGKNYYSNIIHEMTHGYSFKKDKKDKLLINNEIMSILAQYSYEINTTIDLKCLKKHIQSCINILKDESLDNLYIDYKYMIGVLFSISFNYKYGNDIDVMTKAINELISLGDISFNELMNHFSISDSELKYSISSYTKNLKKEGIKI